MSQYGFRLLKCKHCDKVITMTNKQDLVGFCDEGCLNDWLCENTSESKDDLLASMGYAQHREDLEAGV